MINCTPITYRVEYKLDKDIDLEQIQRLIWAASIGINGWAVRDVITDHDVIVHVEFEDPPTPGIIETIRLSIERMTND